MTTIASITLAAALSALAGDYSTIKPTCSEMEVATAGAWLLEKSKAAHMQHEQLRSTLASEFPDRAEDIYLPGRTPLPAFYEINQAVSADVSHNPFASSCTTPHLDELFKTVQESTGAEVYRLSRITKLPEDIIYKMTAPSSFDTRNPDSITIPLPNGKFVTNLDIPVTFGE